MIPTGSAGKSAADVASVGGPAEAERAIGTVTIRGDPRVSEEAFDRLVDAVKAAYYDARFEGVVWVGFRFEDGGTEYFILAQPFEYNGWEYAVLLDEDRRPLYVFDFTAMTWRMTADTLLSFARGERITEVTVEVGERW